MSEDIGLHARLTADSGNTASVMDQFLNKLIQLEQEAKLLKQSQREIEKELDNATKKYGENSQQVKRLRDDLNDNYRGQKQLKDEIKQVNSAIKQQTDEYAKNAKQAENVVSGTERIKNGINMIKAAILGYAGKTLFDALIGDNARFEQYITSFEVMLGSYEEANRMMDDLNDFAAKTPFELTDVTKSAQLLLNYGVAQDEVITKMQQLGDVSQGSADKMNRVALAYGQMVAKQKVTGEELRQMTEAGVPITQALADALDVTTAKLSEMVEKGEVGIPDLNQALEQLTSEGGKFFGMMDKQSQTAMGLFSTLKDNISMFARDVGEESFEYLKSKLQEVMDEISQMRDSGELDAIASDIGEDIAGIIRVSMNFVEILFQIKDYLLAGAVAFGTYKVAVATITPIISGLNTVSNLYGIITGKNVVLKNLETGATTVCTAAKAAEITATNNAMVAQSGLNAVMSANPIGLVATAIGLLVGGLTLYNTTVGQATEKTISMGEKAAETSNELLKLYSQYEALADVSDRTTEQENKFKSVQEELISKLGEKGKALQSLTKDTDTYRDALEKATMAELERQRATITAGAEAAGKELEDSAKTAIGGQKRIYADDEYASMLSGTLGKYRNEGEEYYYAPFEDREEILQFYSDLQQAQIDLTNEYNRLKQAGQEAEAEALLQSKTYSGVTDVLNDLTESVDSYIQMKTEEALINELMKSGMPETTEEYEKLKQSVFEATGANEDFQQNINQIVASNFPQFASSADLAAESLDGMSDSTDGASDKLTGLSKELDKMVSKYETVKSAQDEFKESGTLTASTLGDIIGKYPEMDEAVSKYIAGLIDEQTLLNQLGDYYKTDEENYKNLVLSKVYKSEEFAKILHNSCAEKIDELAKLYEIDLKNFKSLAEAKGEIEKQLLRGLTGYWEAYYNATTNDLNLSFEERNAMENDPHGAAFLKQAEVAISAIDRLNNIALDTIDIKLPSTSFSSYTPKKSSGGSSKSNSSSQDAEQERKELVKAYEESVSELIRLDERWNNQRKLRGEISEQDYLRNLGNRADTYRKFADEVLTLDYMTEEEKAELRKEYLEKAEDLDDEYLKTFQSMQEEEKQAALESINERREASEEWIEHQRKEGNYDEVIAGIERVKAYMKEYYEQGILSAKEYNKAIKELDSDIYNAKRDKFDAWLQDAESYRNDREFYNDWGDDSEEDFFNRVITKIEQAKNAGIITAQEYYSYLSQYTKELYSLGMEEMESYIKKEEERLKEKYQKQMEMQKEAINQENELRQQQFDEELERLDELKRKREEQQEDEDDNLKMERLRNKLEYEVDEDNRKALQKEIDKLQESIDDKMFNRDIERQREKIQQAKEEEAQIAQEKIDNITRYYEQKMSGINIANEILRNINPQDFVGIGNIIGDNISKGIQSKIDGLVRSFRETLREIAGDDNYLSNNSVPVGQTKSTSYTINQKIYGVSTPYQQNLAARKLIDSIEKGVF